MDDEYPIILTSGRVVSQFLSGTQTRRIGPLVDQCAEPTIEMHPHLAKKLNIDDGDWATVESRRGSVTLQVEVVTTIRPDVVFVPYHWAGKRSINQVTIAAQDPISKIPEYKACAVPSARRSGRRTERRSEFMPVPDDMEFFIDPHRCIGCRACIQACGECNTHRGHPMIQLEYVDRAHSTQTVPVVCMHCESPTCAKSVPPTPSRKKRTASSSARQAALRRLQ